MSLKTGQTTLPQMIDEINRLSENTFTTDMIVQTTGQSTTNVMSQKAITDLLNDANNTFARKDGEYVDMVVGKAIMAQVDAEGGYIPDKYAKKTEFPVIMQNGVKKTSINFALSGTTLNITVE